MPARPLFILGRHRSGTTWLANILASVPGIHAITHERHQGVHESAYFSHLVPHCGHGRTEADRQEIKRLFEQSDFFALSGMAQGPDIGRLGTAGYFRAVMDAGASRRNARYWLEKTPANTLVARRLREAFPDAVFLAIVRDYRQVVASLVHGFGDPESMYDWFRQSVLTAIYEKVIATSHATVIRYEALVRDYDGSLRAILAQLGLPPGSAPRSAFRRNTLYAESRPTLRGWQLLAMKAGRWLVLAWPAAVVERAVLRRLDRARGRLPPWFFAAPAAADAAGVRPPP
ncbi:MAG TPA: sulfotransferase [Steroidobacteraceae bacterium]|nr:sulfotransferase [Steroidobacteraceae bacterium]